MADYLSPSFWLGVWVVMLVLGLVLGSPITIGLAIFWLVFNSALLVHNRKALK